MQNLRAEARGVSLVWMHQEGEERERSGKEKVQETMMGGCSEFSVSWGTIFSPRQVLESMYARLPSIDY